MAAFSLHISVQLRLFRIHLFVMVKLLGQTLTPPHKIPTVMYGWNDAHIALGVINNGEGAP